MNNTIFGLKQYPRLSEYNHLNLLDDYGLDDMWKEYNAAPSAHFDEDTVKWFTDAFLSVRDTAKFVMEIGVDEFSPTHSQKYAAESSTQIIKKLKNKNTIYLGLDVADKSYLNDDENNFYTIKADSMDDTVVYNFLESKNIQSIDFLFIDGDHSLIYALNDWRYTQWLSVGGIVVMHDIHWHSGPKEVFNVIDESIFEKTAYGIDRLNWGLGVAKRIK